MAEIDDTLDKVTIAITVKDKITSFDEVLLDIPKAKQALYTDMLELIGEYELDKKCCDLCDGDMCCGSIYRGVDGRNELRQELLTKLKEYFGE